MEEGTLVWAKFAHYPFWPSRLVALEHVPQNIRKSLGKRSDDDELVWFFGSHNYAYVPKELVMPYQKHYSEYCTAKKTTSFKVALNEAEKFEKKSAEERKKEILEAVESEEGESASSEDRPTPKSDKKTKKEIQSEEEELKEKTPKSSQKKKMTPGSRQGPRSSSPKKKRNSTTTEVESPVRSKKSKSAKEEKEKIKSEDETEKKKKIIEQIPKKPWTTGDIQSGLQSIQRHPISKYYKLKVVAFEKGKCHLSAVFSDVRAHCPHEVHSCVGAGYFILDMACYVALMQDLLEEGHSPITQSFTTTIQEAIRPGETVDVHASVKEIKKHLGLAFLDVSIIRSSDKSILMTANVIKTLLAPVIVSPKRQNIAPNKGEESKKEVTTSGEEKSSKQSKAEITEKTSSTVEANGNKDHNINTNPPTGSPDSDKMKIEEKLNGDTAPVLLSLDQ